MTSYVRQRLVMRLVPAPASVDIAIAGVRGAGCNMVQRHQQTVAAWPHIQHLAVNTDRHTITGIQEMPAILLNDDASGVAAVMPWLANCKALYLLAGLGGRTDGFYCHPGAGALGAESGPAHRGAGGHALGVGGRATSHRSPSRAGKPERVRVFLQIPGSGTRLARLLA